MTGAIHVGEIICVVVLVIGSYCWLMVFLWCLYGHSRTHYTRLLQERYQLDFSLYSGINNSPNNLVISTTYGTLGTIKIM